MKQYLIHEDNIVDVQEVAYSAHPNTRWVDAYLTVEEEAEILAALQVEIDSRDADLWLTNRIVAYKDAFSVTDQIDIIQKQMQSMIDLGEVTATAEVTQWLTDIAQIKTDNPKPDLPEVANKNAVR